MYSRRHSIIFNIVSILMAFSFVYILLEGTHDCSGVDCLICSRLSLCCVWLLSVNYLMQEVQNTTVKFQSFVISYAWKLEEFLKERNESAFDVFAILYNVLSKCILNPEDFLSCFYNASLVNKKVRLNN